MNWPNLFTSRHTLFLEREFEDLKTRHAQELADLKKTHLTELERVISDCERLRSEVDRLRLYLSPELQSIGRQVEESTAKEEFTSFGGTPWQQILRREKEADIAAGNFDKRHTKPAAPVATPEPKGAN